MKRIGTKNLTYTQRLQLEALLKSGCHKRDIAKILGVCLATIYNELARGRYEHKKYSYTDWLGERHYKTVVGYSPNLAQDRYRLNQSAHGAPIKLGNDYQFVRYVEKRIIKDKLSPCAVLGEINRDNMFRTRISKTTMYRYISNGIFMNITMSHLPFGQRKKHYRRAIAKRPPRGTSIERRPQIVNDRFEFGHWEMDCVCGSTLSSLLVLTERKTRKEIIFRMPNQQTVSVIRCLNVLERRYGTKFRKVFKTITVDNGSEFSDFVGMEKSSYRGKRTSIYYCHPYRSCERGSNERINRDIRRLIPKGSDIAKYSDEDIRFVEDWVNSYPREIFGFATSAELFAQEIALI